MLRARWIALHPYAAFYAGLGDFQLWRFRGEIGQFVGGFASAHRFGPAQLAPEGSAVVAMTDAEASVIEHCNDDHPDAMDAIAVAHGGVGAGWRMVTCDVDGCDLARDEAVVRVDWAAPVDNAGAVRGELVRLTKLARNLGVTARPGPG
jgi:putative heme iron utilization protein